MNDFFKIYTAIRLAKSCSPPPLPPDDDDDDDDKPQPLYAKIIGCGSAVVLIVVFIWSCCS